jgi:hypothetical protein
MNTDRTKLHLNQALAALPGDFALGETRAAIKTALAKLEQVEEKRERRATRQTLHDQWAAALKSGIASVGGNYPMPAHVTEQSVKVALSRIDRMIKAEQDKLTKLGEIKVSKASPGPPVRQNTGGDGDVQQFLG